MITSIRLKNFKNFADETLRVGPFTILVGANASGKSNIRDAFRFLSGIGRGYTLTEIFGGKREAGWEPIRGAMNEIARFGQEAFSIEVGLKLDGEERYYLAEAERDAVTGAFKVRKEELRTKSEIVYARRQASGGTTTIREYSCEMPHCDTDLGKFLSHNPQSSELCSILTDVCFALHDTRFLELSPERMREPAFPGTTLLGDSGENLSVALQKICADAEREKILTSWIAELTPMDVQGFEFSIDPSGRVYLTIREKNGRRVSASSASDGTLRFLAMLALLLGNDSAGLYFFDEIDTGIHPARLYLLLELIEKQTAKNNIQVVTTTHAPDLLTFVNDSTFENMSVVCRLENSQDAIIRPVAELPNARKLRTSQGGLGRLLTSRWMETALAFTEDYDEAEDDL